MYKIAWPYAVKPGDMQLSAMNFLFGFVIEEMIIFFSSCDILSLNFLNPFPRRTRQAEVAFVSSFSKEKPLLGLSL